jgi:hypothetical protein
MPAALMPTLYALCCISFRDDILNAIPSEMKCNNSATSVWTVTNCDTMDRTGTPQSYILGILCAQSLALAVDNGFLRFALGLYRPSTIRNYYAVSMYGMERGPRVAKRLNSVYKVKPSRSASGSQSWLVGGVGKQSLRKHFRSIKDPVLQRKQFEYSLE